jgi:hypothetical protein
MVLFTKEYFPISVLCLLLLIFKRSGEERRGEEWCIKGFGGKT